MKITKIVLTGAPCSGKTKAIERIKNYYSNKNYNVVVMSESARELIMQGVSRDNMLLFEKAVIQHQLEQEKIIDTALATVKDKDSIVIYDRGIADAFSYVSSNGVATLQKDLGLDIISVWSRYDAVIMLECPSESNYANDNERTENYQDALKSQQSLLNQWVGHPHLRFVKSTASFDDKIINTIKEIDCVLNDIEHEVKYLIEYPDIDALSKYNIFKTDIEQIYLLSDIGSHRIRKRGANNNYCYFETIKIRISGDKCTEIENIISKEKYYELKALADPNKHPIVKNRYCLLYKGQYFELDVFPFWSDKALLELELSSDDQIPNLPPEIKVIKDVSKSKKYKNNYLASVKFNENS